MRALSEYLGLPTPIVLAGLILGGGCHHRGFVAFAIARAGGGRDARRGLLLACVAREVGFAGCRRLFFLTVLPLRAAAADSTAGGVSFLPALLAPAATWLGPDRALDGLPEYDGSAKTLGISSARISSEGRSTSFACGTKPSGTPGVPFWASARRMRSFVRFSTALSISRPLCFGRPLSTPERSSARSHSSGVGRSGRVGWLRSTRQSRSRPANANGFFLSCGNVSSKYLFAKLIPPGVGRPCTYLGTPGPASGVSGGRMGQP
jgi:hypothetical protein